MDGMLRYEERIRRISKALNRDKPDRVPVVLKLYGWLVQYYGYSMEDFYVNKPQIAVEIYGKAIEEFGFDGVFNANNVTPIAATRELGGGLYQVGEDGIQVSNLSAHIMKADEYALIRDDFIGFLRDVILPRRFSKLSGGNAETAFQAFKAAYEKYKWYMGSVVQDHAEIEKAGCPIMWGKGVLIHPIDFIMDYLRDFSGVLVDMRRQPEAVLEAAHAMQRYFIEKVYPKFQPFADGHGVFWPMHLAPYLKPKDFERFYWPFLKETLEYCINRKIYAGLFMEGSWEPYYDLLQDLPDNNYLIGSLEKGDYKKFKEKLGKKFTLCGGVPVSVLGYKTKEECAAHTRQLIDDCAQGGGFIVDTDMAVLTLNDAKPENIKTVIQTVMEYGQY